MAVIAAGSQLAVESSVGDSSHEIPTPSITDLQRLSEKATFFLADTARRSGSGDGLNTSDAAFISNLPKLTTMARQR